MVPREFRSCRRLRPKRPMASFYDTAPTRFGIGPLFPRRRLPAECFPSPPVPESAPLSGFVSPLAGTARLPESASPSNSFTIGLTGNFRPRISLCASISLSGLVSLLCLCFLLCLPCPARHPGPHGNHGGSGKNALCRYLLPQNASVLHNHAHASGKTAGTAAAVLWVRRALRADRTLRRNSTRPFSSLTLSPLLTSSSSLNRKCV